MHLHLESARSISTSGLDSWKVSESDVRYAFVGKQARGI